MPACHRLRHTNTHKHTHIHAAFMACNSHLAYGMHMHTCDIWHVHIRINACFHFLFVRFFPSLFYLGLFCTCAAFFLCGTVCAYLCLGRTAARLAFSPLSFDTTFVLVSLSVCTSICSASVSISAAAAHP